MIDYLIPVLCCTGSLLFGMFLTRQRRVKNKDAKPTEASHYIVQWNPFNAPTRHTFTSSGATRAGIRANKQPEDYR